MVGVIEKMFTKIVSISKGFYRIRIKYSMLHNLSYHPSTTLGKGFLEFFSLLNHFYARNYYSALNISEGSYTNQWDMGSFWIAVRSGIAGSYSRSIFIY